MTPNIEQHFTIAELAGRLSVSLEKMRQMVMDEPGVVKVPGAKKVMYRIPESVAERIVRRVTNP